MRIGGAYACIVRTCTGDVCVRSSRPSPRYSVSCMSIAGWSAGKLSAPKLYHSCSASGPNATVKPSSRKMASISSMHDRHRVARAAPRLACRHRRVRQSLGAGGRSQLRARCVERRLDRHAPGVEPRPASRTVLLRQGAEGSAQRPISDAAGAPDAVARAPASIARLIAAAGIEFIRARLVRVDLGDELFERRDRWS